MFKIDTSCGVQPPAPCKGSEVASCFLASCNNSTTSRPRSGACAPGQEGAASRQHHEDTQLDVPTSCVQPHGSRLANRAMDAATSEQYTVPCQRATPGDVVEHLHNDVNH
ncbi:hypothetical protein PybrP1_006524 [[Pythium] brassicae (nom. inval.)]|nr:hypothetical protein PybrP1_006524 [[Pythium] brassicae (nom. inval.)]